MATRKKAAKAAGKRKHVLSVEAQKQVSNLETIARSATTLSESVPRGRGMTKEARKTSNGRFRVGESAKLVGLLDIIDARPELFVALAPQDRGDEPTVVETGPTRDSLAIKVAADEAANAAEKLAKSLRDYALAVGEQVRDVTAAAYGIVKASAVVNAALRDEAKPLADFYAFKGTGKRT